MACEKNRTKLLRISRTISSAFGGSQILANSGQHQNKNSYGEQSTIIDLSEKIEMVDDGVIFSKKK